MYLQVHLESLVRFYAQSCRHGMPVLQAWGVQDFLKQLVHMHDKLPIRLNKKNTLYWQTDPDYPRLQGKRFSKPRIRTMQDL